MKRHLIFLAAILSISFTASAQTGVLIGQIGVPAGEGEPAVSVFLEGTSVYTHADSSGRFMLKSAPGSYRLQVHAAGMQSRVLPVRIDPEDTTILKRIVLERKRQQLRELVVEGERRRYDAKNTSSSLRLVTPLQEIPQNIQVITSRALDDQQVTSLAEGVIRNVSGATKLEHWSSYTRINMRGARASEFRNGMNVTSDWGPLSADMSIVDRIEFVKGPAGFMMSNGDPSGIFNIVTKKPTGLTGGEASLMFGSFDLYRATLDVDGHLDKSRGLLYRLDLMGQTENSFQANRFNNRYTLHPVITYKLDPRTNLTAEYTLQYDRMSDMGTPYVFSPKGYADLPRNFTTLGAGVAPATIRDQTLFLYLDHKFNEHWKLSVHGAYLHSSQIGSDAWPSSLDSAGNMIRSISIGDALNLYKFGQAFVNGSFQTGRVHHQILAGLDLGDKENYYDWSQSFLLDDAQHPFNIYHPDYSRPVNGYPQYDRSVPLRERAGLSIVTQSYSGIYLQDELGFFDNKVRLTLAGRYTYVKQSDYGTDYHDSKITPRVGLSVSLDPHTSVYALRDQSFLPQSGLLRGDRAPKPLTGNNLEVGVKRDWFGERWTTTLSVYRILENGKLTTDPDTTDNQNNRYSLQVGQNKTQGVELDVRGEIVKGLNVVVNYAYTDSRISKDLNKALVGTTVPGFAKHDANAWLTYTIQQGSLKGLGFSAGATYMKDRSTWDWGATSHDRLPDYLNTDAGVHWQYHNVKVNLTVGNVLNKYLYSGAPYGNYYYWQAEAPRNFKLGFDFRF